MSNFVRALRIALRYRATIATIVLSSTLVGVLWGANITAVYPFVQVVFRGQSMHDWVDQQISTANASSEKLDSAIAELRSLKLPANELEAASRRREMQFLESRLAAELRWLQRCRWLEPWIKTWLPGDPFQTLLVIVAIMVLGTALKDLFLVINLVVVERLVQLTTFDLRKQFFRQSLQLDLAAFGQGRDSELLSRFTNDMSNLAISLNCLFGRALREPLKMVVCLIVASTISWQLLVLSLIVAPPALLLMRKLASSIKRANRRAMEEVAQLYNTLSESFRGIQTVKAFTMEPYERNRFHQSAKQYYQKSMRIAFYNSLTKPLTEVLGLGVISLALVSGAYLVLEQETQLFGIKMCDRPMEIGRLLLFYGMLIGTTDPIRKMSDVLGAVQGGVAASDRIFALMDRESEIMDPDRSKALPAPHQRIVFDKVDFHYDSQMPVLRGIDLEIKYGETIALVGPNGCGKSTLVNLIPRFFDPQAGAVMMCDIDLRDLRRRDLRQRIGIVSQQTHLFDDTVMNNIRYGSPQASDEAVIEAARKAHADRFINEKLRDGFATMVGSGGGRLSGGQRQRIALARAILRDPEILILDEATSQIDIESEQLIHKALEAFIVDRTAIMITHRMSTLALADRVVVMDAGRIVDVGGHSELLERCAVYRRLHDIHFQKSA